MTVFAPRTPDRPDFASLLTRDEFLRLVEEFGGTKLYIPSVPNPKQRVAQVIGMRAAKRLAREAGSTYWRIPMARDLRMLHYRDKGMSHRKIARLVGMSVVGVERALKRLRQDAQPDTYAQNEATPEVAIPCRASIGLAGERAIEQPLRGL